MIARIPQFYGSAHIKKKKDWQSLAVGPYTCLDLKNVLYVFTAFHNKVSSATGVNHKKERDPDYTLNHRKFQYLAGGSRRQCRGRLIADYAQ